MVLAKFLCQAMCFFYSRISSIALTNLSRHILTEVGSNPKKKEFCCCYGCSLDCWEKPQVVSIVCL